MKSSFRIIIPWLFAIAAFVAWPYGRADSDLMEYVGREEPEFRWMKTEEKTSPEGTVVELHLISQVWQGIKWEHRVVLFIPRKVEFPETAVLLNTGGDVSDNDRALGAMMANAAGCSVAILYQVPNQPLFEGLNEDELIAYTFEKFLKSRDESWPLLFPMVKSVVKAMDALQDLTGNTLQQPIKSFIITGASKRGWTTWLTAVTDVRVKGIMPIVYDNLNIAAQMPHQIESWGAYSEQIQAYTKRGLQAKMETGDGRRLVGMVDPYTYRAKLTMPKLIINGTNDRYWTLDALNQYWDSLPGRNYVLYVPNVGHGLRPAGIEKVPVQDMIAALARPHNSMINFTRLVASGKPLTKIKWKHFTKDGKAKLTVKSNPKPKEVRLWVARSETRDFRSARWESSLMKSKDGKFEGELAVPDKGFAALFGEVFYETDGRRYSFSTQLRIVP